MIKSKPKVRTRFAPSPTGWLHIGGLRTALYNYLFAKQNKGNFILRIEDTDRERLVPGAKKSLASILKSFKLNYDEGFDIGGNFGPYIQSQRLEIYQKYAKKLIETKQAYYCFCSNERLEKLRKEQKQKKLPPKYDRHCLNLSPTEIKKKLDSGAKFVIRLKIPEGETKFNDLIRGEIKINNEILDDQILIKSDGYPTYHLAVVIDDHLMKISHVIRGEEWIPSTPKHIILYDAFKWPKPKFAHLPLLLNPDKSKLSKRQGDVAVENYLQKGYLPEALLNFIALLGWNPGDNQEIFSLTELEKRFRLEKVQKAGAIFDLIKLNWMNSQYIKKADNDYLVKKALPFLKNIENFSESKYDLKQIINLFKERLNYLQELTSKAQFIYKIHDYDPNILIFKKSNKEITIKALTTALKVLEKITDFTSETLRLVYDKEREVAGLSRAEMFWPMRVAITGQEKSPDVFDIIHILGKKETKNRFKNALDKLNKL